MNSLVLPVGGLLAAIGGVAYFWWQAGIREHVRLRLSDVESAPTATERLRAFTVRYRWVALLVGVACATLFAFLFAWPLNISIALGLVIGILALEIDAWIYEWKLSRIESQLADAIDVLVASVGAGSSLQGSLGQAAEFSPMPLRRELTEMVARLRLGDSPTDVFYLLSQRVPSETFRLLSTTLSVNWESGGGLTQTLAGIGQTIRDRLVIARQIRTLSTQGRLTSATVLAVIWFMAAMMWQADPPRFESFLLSTLGSWLITVSLVLQGFGVALVSRISRPKV